MSLAPLYLTYQTKSGSKLTQEQFDRFILFFPALLVIASDGEIDEEEWVYVDFLAKGIADSFKEQVPDERKREEMKVTFRKELDGLIARLDMWEAIFIPALRKYLDDFPEVKEDVDEILHIFAEASDGESEDELAKIRELHAKLGIEEEDMQ